MTFVLAVVGKATALPGEGADKVVGVVAGGAE